MFHICNAINYQFYTPAFIQFLILVDDVLVLCWALYKYNIDSFMINSSSRTSDKCEIHTCTFKQCRQCASAGSKYDSRRTSILWKTCFWCRRLLFFYVRGYGVEYINWSVWCSQIYIWLTNNSTCKCTE